MSKLQAAQKDAETATNEDDEEELVVIEEGNESQARPEKPAKQASKEPDEDDDQDDGGDDGRLANRDEDDEDADAQREAIRARRREEKREQRERRRQAEARTKRENAQYQRALEAANARIAALEARQVSSEAQQVDNRLRNVEGNYNEARRVYQHAIASADGRLADEALQRMRQAERDFEQLRSVKQRLQEAPVQKPQPVQADDTPDPRVVEMAEDFVARHKWYDPEGKDEESAIVKAIDDKLANDGYDPSDEEYWVELERRVQRRLPHRFKPVAEKKSGPPIGSGREHAPASARTEVYVSKERKQALIDAGIWNDPVRRAKALKAYARYDRDNKQATR